MRVLITGGCGFLGSNLCNFYLHKGCEVVLVDNLSRYGANQNLNWLSQQAQPNQLSFCQVDIAKEEEIQGVFLRHRPIDYVCHVAGQVAMTKSLENPMQDFLTNAKGTLNILECIRTLSPKAFLAYSSTNKVYGDLNSLRLTESRKRFNCPNFPVGLDETIPLDFSTPYGCSKGCADQYVRDWARTFGIETTVFRHSSIYGSRQFATKDQGWVGWFCQVATAQATAHQLSQAPEPFTISGTGKQVRDCLFSTDLTELYDLAYQRRAYASGEIFNIGGGMSNSLSILELLDLLCQLLKIDQLTFDYIPRRQSDQDFFVADISKANKLLSWSPKIPVLEGVERMLAWITESRQCKNL